MTDTPTVVREVDWLSGDRRFPGEGGKTHAENRYYISSAILDAERASQAARGHWGIESRLHWVLVFEALRTGLRSQ